MNPRAKPVQVSLAVFAFAALVVTWGLWHYLGLAPWLCALVAINLMAFPLWGWDKLQAQRGGWRVPEMTLHLVAALGAAGSSLACMHLFRHKTRKRAFTVLYSALLVAQIFGLLMLLRPPSAS